MIDPLIVDLQRKAYSLAFSFYIRTGRVPTIVTEIVEATKSDAAFHKYNPDWASQPRKPAGSGEESGRWTDEAPPPGYVYTWTNEPEPRRILVVDEPGLKPAYPAEALIAVLATLSVSGAIATTSLLIRGGRALYTSYKILKAAQAIEDYLGGRPDKIFRNPKDDLVIMRGDKKIRFDIRNPGSDKPHYHIETKPSGGGRWPDSGANHRHYFQD